MGVNDVDPVAAPPEMNDAENAEARAIANHARSVPGRVSFASKELDDLARRLGIDSVTAIGPNARDIRALIEQARIVSVVIEHKAQHVDVERRVMVDGAWALVVYAQDGRVYQREMIEVSPGDKVVPLADAIDAIKRLAR